MNPPLNKESINILAIETATNACSVALLTAGAVFEEVEFGNNIHSRVLLSMVSELLAAAELPVQALDAVAVGNGPGSFTGLRIGIGVAQGLAFGAGCSLIGISSLDALAVQASQEVPALHNGERTILVGIDARMGEIYCAEYAVQQDGAGRAVRLGEIQVLPPASIRALGPKPLLVGNAWRIYQDALAPELQNKVQPSANLELPHAKFLLSEAAERFAQGLGVAPGDFQPRYVRNEVAKKSVKSPLG